MGEASSPDQNSTGQERRVTRQDRRRPKPLEVETPLASARVKQTEFDIKVQEDGETTLRVLEGVVEFGTAFGTCLIRTGTISYGVRGKKCTKPKEENHAAALDWAKELARK